MNPHTILVVEDNPATRMMVCAAMSKRGHRVLDAADGKSAIRLMQAEQPVLVLQDVVLPDVDGIQLVGDLRRCARGEIAILALLGFRSRREEARISAVGFDDVIIKPIEPARLIPIVEAYLPSSSIEADRFGAGRRLVLADDDPALLKLTKYRLEKLGFLVDTATDGAEAIKLIEASPPDAVISDVLMPNLDGFGVALAIRQNPRLATLPLLLVTSSYLDESDRDFSRRLGASDLVLRTPDQREMIQALRKLFVHPRVTSPPEPVAVPELEKERTERVVRQLERHVVMNAGLARRCSALSAELAVLAGISEAVLKDQNAEAALDVALAACFDAGGISVGGLYLSQPDDGFRVRPLGTKLGWKPDDLASFFGELPLLRRIIASGSPAMLPSAPYGDQSVREMLRRCGGSAAMVVPLLQVEQPIGALLMVAEFDELEQEDWLVFAQGVSSQIAQALALASAFSQREAAERRALESRAEWQALAEQAPDTIERVDRQGVIQFVNRATPPRTTRDLVGRPWLESIPVHYHEELSAALQRVLTTGAPSSHEVMLPSTDGKTDRQGGQRMEWFSNRIGPVLTEGVITGAIVISRNITQQKQEEAQLIVADRMASVGTLAAGVAHEINNPLSAVIANLDLAHRQVHDEAARSGNRELVEYLQDAQEAAERVRLIVRDLKVFSRAENNRTGPTDVRAVLESTLRMAWNEIRHRARLIKEYAPLPPVDANESRLGQVFLNLIINATHAIPEGQAKQNEIRVSTRMDESGMVAIDVTDSGVGMSESVQRRLFTPFFTTKAVGVGTGLGLSICQRLISAMNGQIRVHSKVDHGSTFTVLLPVANPGVVDARPPQTEGSGTIGANRRGRVLVIDDEEVVAMAISRALSREHEVVYSGTAQQALQLLRVPPPFDLILCDLMMPEMTGMDLYGELLKFAPEQAHRMIFVTGGAFTTRAREFLEEVPNLRIEKPFDVKQLRALVNERVR